MAQRILVTGGAGYIGSHMARMLAEFGHEVIIIDNLSTGHRQACRWGELLVVDLRDLDAIQTAFHGRHIDAVFHFAATIVAGESVTDPEKYYTNNLNGTINLLTAMRRYHISRIIFSSTAAIYGNPITDTVAENHSLAPLNPYGRTKSAIEDLLADYYHAYGLASVSLCYFNAAGAHPDGSMGESHSPETHLIPNAIIAALSHGPELRIFGTDYPTPDGSCIRDYVHVQDLCTAHLAALSHIDVNLGAYRFNLGTGRGHSIRELLQIIHTIVGHPVPHRIAPRRPSDAAILVANNSHAQSTLHWTLIYPSLTTIINHAIHWHSQQTY
ncbi:UDP-glucose 4-epimerase [Desulfovibrionales bacterium]